MKRNSRTQKGIGDVQKSVVGYLRISTDGQEDGYGLDVQRQHIVAYAAVNGYQVERWYEDVESGAKEERPGLDELRSDVASGAVERVLVYRLDRLAREALLSERLYRELSSKAQVISVSEVLAEGFTGDLMRRILAAFADYERAVIAARTKNGRRASVKQNGTYAGGPGVLGYRPVGRRGEPGKGALTVVESESDAVRMIFDLRAQGQTLQAIASTLNEKGYRTRQGAKFSHVQVLRVLDRQEFYTGSGVLNRSIQTDRVAHTPLVA